MSDIKKIISDRTYSERIDGKEKFLNLFFLLYKIPSYRKSLDLILTNASLSNISFEIKIIKNWDTNVGCFLTYGNKFSNRLLNIFQSSTKIIIKKISLNVIAHEVAHAVELFSGINLNKDEDFIYAITQDMKSGKGNFALKGEIKRILIDDIKLYPKRQIYSEYFARYFEILSLTKELNGRYGFSIKDVEIFFKNTTEWLKKKFSVILNIDQKIENNRRNSLKITQEEKKFTDSTDSFFQKGSSWSKNVKSNAVWQKKFKK